MTDGFPGSMLSPDEDLVFDLRPHWIALAKPFAQTLAIAAGLGLAWLVMPYAWGAWGYAATILIAIGLLLLGPTRPLVRWLTSHFVLTTSRIIRRSGWIAKESIEIPLAKISDVRFRQSVLERMLKAGDLTIESAGRLGQERLQTCRDPERVQRLIYEIRERAVGREELTPGAPMSAQGWGPVSVADEVAKLYELVERGVISGEEFQAAKSKLLRRV
jgi:membrane protein YdbS with pleckstrin-like domain